MPKNLRQKIALVLEDCESMPKHELLRRLERVILEELNFLDAEHSIDSVDLSTIRSQAITNYSEMRHDEAALGRIYSDGEMIRTLCMVQAVNSFLRSKGLVNFILTFNKK